MQTKLKLEKKMYKTQNGWTKSRMITAIKTRNKGRVSYDRDQDVCMYSMKDGNHCAVGVFLPPGIPGIRSFVGNVEMLLDEHPKLVTKLPLSEEALMVLQKVHDGDVAPTGRDPRPAMIAWIKENVTD